MIDGPTDSLRRAQRRVDPSLPARRQPIIAAGLLLEAAFTASIPLAFRLLIDRAIVPRDTQMLTTLLALLTIGVVIAIAAGLGRDYLYARLCSKILRDLRLEMRGTRASSLAGRHRQR